MSFSELFENALQSEKIPKGAEQTMTKESSLEAIKAKAIEMATTGRYVDRIELQGMEEKDVIDACMLDKDLKKHRIRVARTISSCALPFNYTIVINCVVKKT